MKFREFLNQPYYTFNDHVEMLGLNQKDVEFVDDVMMDWHMEGEPLMIEDVSNEPAYVKLMKLNLFMDINSYSRDATTKTLPFNRLINFLLDDNQITVYKGGAGTFDPAYKPSKIGSSSYLRSIAESYMTHDAAKSSKTFMSANKDGFLVSCKVAMKDIIAYTNVGNEMEIITLNKHNNSPQVLSTF